MMMMIVYRFHAIGPTVLAVGRLGLSLTSEQNLQTALFCGPEHSEFLAAEAAGAVTLKYAFD